ncbi:MAG: hypothetical protein RIT27_2227 [Pseudomonadota bacterium]|jgi:uncharacterized protein (DUF2249 family)
MPLIQIDVRFLEPCKPLEQVLAALQTLPTGDCLHVLHRLEPFPLYEMLKQQGFKWITRSISPEIPIELFIWKENDSIAEQIILTL